MNVTEFYADASRDSAIDKIAQVTIANTQAAYQFLNAIRDHLWDTSTDHLSHTPVWESELTVFGDKHARIEFCAGTHRRNRAIVAALANNDYLRSLASVTECSYKYISIRLDFWPEGLVIESPPVYRAEMDLPYDVWAWLDRQSPTWVEPVIQDKLRQLMDADTDE